MSEFTPDISDTLFIWSMLEKAKEGTNPYGENVAEVYVKHLLPHKLEASNPHDVWKLAGRNLHTVLNNFCTLNGVKANINGQEVGDWLDNFEIMHKCDVLIYKSQSEAIVKKVLSKLIISKVKQKPRSKNVRRR